MSDNGAFAGGPVRYFLWPEELEWGGFARRVKPEHATTPLVELLSLAGLSAEALSFLAILREVGPEEYYRAKAAHEERYGVIAAEPGGG